MSDEMIKFKSSGLGGGVCGHDSVMECNEFMQDKEKLPDQPANEFELDSYAKENAFSSGGICCDKESGLLYYFSGMKFGDYSSVKDIQFKPATPEEVAKAPAEAAAEAGEPDMVFEPGETEAAPAAEKKPAVEKPDVTEIESEDALYDMLKGLGEGEYAIVNFSKPKHKGCSKYERPFRRMAKRHKDKATFAFVGESNSDAWSSFREKLSIDKKAPAVFAMDREGNCYEVTRIYKPFRTIRDLEKGKQTMGTIAKIEIPADEPVEEAVEIPLEPIKPEKPSIVDEAIGAVKEIDPVTAGIIAGGIAVLTGIIVFRKRVINLARSIGSGMAAAKDSAVAKMKSIADGMKAKAADKAAEKQAKAAAKAADKKAAEQKPTAAEQKPAAKPAEAKPEPAKAEPEQEWLKEMKEEAEAAALVAKESEAEAKKKAAEEKKAAKKADAEAKKKAAEERKAQKKAEAEAKKKAAAKKKTIDKAKKEHNALMKSYEVKKKALGKVIDPALKQRMIDQQLMIVELGIHEQIKGEAWYIKLNPDQRIEVLRKIAEGQSNIGVEGISKVSYSPSMLLAEPKNSTDCQIIPAVDESAATIFYENEDKVTSIALERGFTPKQQKQFQAEYDAIIKQIKALPLEVRVGFLELGIDADGLAGRLVMQRYVTGEVAWKAITTPFGKGKGVFKNYPPKFVESKMEASKRMADPAADLDLARDAIPNLKKYLPSTLELKQAEEAQKAKVEAEAKAKAEAEAKAKAEAEAKAKAEAEAKAKAKTEAEAKAKAKAKKQAEVENTKRLAQFKKDQAAKKKAAQAWITEIDKIKDPELKARMEGIEFLKRELLVHDYLKTESWYQDLDPNARVDVLTAIVEGADHLNVGGKEMKVSIESQVYDKPITEDGKVVNEELVAIIREGDAEGGETTIIPIEREISKKDAVAFAKEYEVLVEKVLLIDNDIKVTFLDRDITTDTVVSRLIMRKHVMSDAEWNGYTNKVQVAKAKGIDAIYPKALIDSAAKNIEGYANPIGETAKTLVTLPKMGRKNVVMMGAEEFAKIAAEAGVEGVPPAPKKPGPPPPPAAAGKKPSSQPPPPPPAAAGKKPSSQPPPPTAKKATPPPPPPPSPEAKVIVDPSALLDLSGISESGSFDIGETDFDNLVVEERVCVDPGDGSAGKPPPMPVSKPGSQNVSGTDAVTVVPPPPPASSEAKALAEWEKFEKGPYFEYLEPILQAGLLKEKVEIGKVVLQNKADPAFANNSKMMVGDMITLEGYNHIIERSFGVNITAATFASNVIVKAMQGHHAYQGLQEFELREHADAIKSMMAELESYGILHKFFDKTEVRFLEGKFDVLAKASKKSGAATVADLTKAAEAVEKANPKAAKDAKDTAAKFAKDAAKKK